MARALPKFTTPTKPNLRPVMELHRGHDGFITFHRKHPETGDHEDLFSVPAAELVGIFPQLMPTLERDSYFSIHGFYRSGYGVARNAPDDHPLFRAHRRKDNLRWLTCCFADIDCHNLGVTVGEALGSIVDAQDRGDIPPASMLTRSGRGLWAFWLLKDARKEKALQRAMPERVREWANIQHVIGARMAGIGADAMARDSVRITRIAGSVNSKSETRVGYWLQAGEDGKPFVYTIDGLNSFFGMDTTPKAPRVDSAAKKFSDRGRKGQRGRWLKSRADFNTLWAIRETWAEGTRNNAAFVYATILGYLGVSEDEIWAELLRLYAAFEQPARSSGGHRFTERDLKTAVQGVGRPKMGHGPVRNQTIADWLQITLEESELLEVWPAATCHSQKPPPADLAEMSPAEKGRLRRFLLLHFIDSEKKKGRRLPTLETIADHLDREGIPTSAMTVANDLGRMGISNPRRHGRRKPKRAQNLTSKLF